MGRCGCLLSLDGIGQGTEVCPLVMRVLEKQRALTVHMAALFTKNYNGRSVSSINADRPTLICVLLHFTCCVFGLRKTAGIYLISDQQHVMCEKSG